MGSFATLADLQAIEAESAWADRALPASIYGFLSDTAATHGSRPAISFQLLSDPKAPSQMQIAQPAPQHLAPRRN